MNTKTQPAPKKSANILASKEECDKAIEALERIKGRTGDVPDVQIVATFLNVARTRLPRKASYERAATKASEKRVKTPSQRTESD